MIEFSQAPAVSLTQGRRRAQVWPLISGQNSTSPRTEIPIAMMQPETNNSALIVGQYKLLIGPQDLACKTQMPIDAFSIWRTRLANLKGILLDFISDWQGPAFPNG